MRYILLIIILCLGDICSNAKSKLSLQDRKRIDLLDAGSATYNNTRGNEVNDVVVMFTVVEGTTESDIYSPGIKVVDHIGNAFIVKMPLGMVDQLLKNERIIAAEFDKCDSPDMFYARMEGNSNINNAHIDPINDLGGSFLGKGVICGVFDIGFDVNHVDFLDNENRNETRVKKLMIFEGNDATPAIDTEDPEEIKKFTTDNTENKHGTHVLGIMAGSYYGSGRWNDIDMGPDSLKSGLMDPNNLGEINHNDDKPVAYYGVAPKADIVICGNTEGLYGGAQLTGARRIIEYSKRVGKPCVINYSLGSQWGPRDGSSPEDVMLSELAKEAIICKSAGNDGEKDDYFSETFTDDRKSIATILSFPGIDDNRGELGFWLNDNRSVSFDLFLYATYYNPLEYEEVSKEVKIFSFAGPIVDVSGNSMTRSLLPEDLPDQLEGVFSGRINVSADVMSQNDRYCIDLTFDKGFKLNTVKMDGMDCSVKLGIRFYGDAGQRIDGNCCGKYAKFVGNMPGYVVPSPCLSISNGACAPNIIAVGSYSNRSAMRYLDNSVWVETNSSKGAGNIAPSSGYGIKFDGTTRPQIATPGVCIVSASSRYYNSDKKAVAVAELGSEKYYFCEMSGTSMSCPLFAGICALWLEADPTLDYDGIMDVLEHTARKDRYTESEPMRYGFGKADAYEGLKYILANKKTGMRPVEIDTDHILVVPVGNNIYEITVGMGETFHADLYSLTGSKLISVEGRNTVKLGLTGIDNGIYVLRIGNKNFSKSMKIIIR